MSKDISNEKQTKKAEPGNGFSRRGCACRIRANMATTERTPTIGIVINANATKSRIAAAEANPKSAERTIRRTCFPGRASTSRDIETEMSMSLNSWAGGIPDRNGALRRGCWVVGP
jgi:hypothetical protein